MKEVESIERLVACFKSLPGVGAKTAERYAYSIINADKDYAENFANSILCAKRNVKYCKECGNFTENEICSFCQKRSHEVICVVKEPKDVDAIEKIKSFSFAYHVLHGTLSPLDGRGPDDIRIKELLERVNKHKTKEVIMATNPDVEGDATALYIARLLTPLGVKVSRLAQGISMGSDIEYADEVTLTKAIESRQTIE